MQIHLSQPHIGTPYINQPDEPDSFAILPLGSAEAYVASEAEADDLIRAACLLKDRLAEHRERHSPIWAVFDSIEGEVAGPKTHAEAEAYIKANDSWHTGELTIGRAVTDLDAAPALSGAEKAEATTPPGHQLPAGDVPGWDEPLPPYYAMGTTSPCCGAGDSGYICTAQAGHAGPLHIAYDAEVPGRHIHSWPVAEVPAGTDAR